MRNSILSSKYVLLTATILSAIMLAASLVPWLFPTTAFAASDTGGVIVDPSVQTSVQTAKNINVDPDVILSVGCVDISDDDKVTQVNEQTADQDVHKNDHVGDGGVIADPSVQTSVQTAVNINVDKNVFIVLGCNDGKVKISDDDKVTQVNEQTADQDVHIDSEVGDGGMHISPTIQKSAQTSLNLNQDDNHVIMIPLPN